MTDDDALWIPELDTDPELRRMQALLSPFSVRSRGLTLRPNRQISRRNRARRVAWTLVALATACALVMGVGIHRLAWQSDKPWGIVTLDTGGQSTSGALAPGSMVTTGVGETVKLAVARIGELTLSPDSQLELTTTRTGMHRVRLDVGHMRARIWAPPGYFGVQSGAAEVIDLGCDFDLWKQVNGRGRVYVRNGWIAYQVASREVLVPAGYAMQFDATNFSTPVRSNADQGFVDAMRRLDQAIADDGSDSVSAVTAADQVAARATDNDAYSLLSLLSSQPRLASSDLYPRLAKAFSLPATDAAHRRAWTEGSQDAINAWWKKLPVQPKQWLGNWTDLFG